MVLWVIRFNPRSYERNSWKVSHNTISVSIHAPTKGATLNKLSEVIDAGVFQSTLLRKERLSTISPLFMTICVSIHAPTKGATVSVLLAYILNRMFQSTLLRKERRK